MRFNTFADVSEFVLHYVRIFIPVVFALGVLAFFWNGGRFIYGSGSESSDPDERKNWLIYGVLALFVAVTLYGIIALLQDFFFPNQQIDSLSPGEIYNPALPLDSLPPASNS